MRTIIYHANCYDGVTAAWVCYEALDMGFEGGVSNVEYIACNYSDPPPNVKGKDVIIVDFSFKRPILEEMRKQANSLVILDHHKTAEEDLRGFPNAIFDMNKSGAGITWDYCFPHSPRPALVNYVEDRDLWKFKLPFSKEITAWIQSFEINLDVWINTVGPKSFIMDNISIEPIVEQGESLLRMRDNYVKAICYNAKLKKIREYTAPYVQTAILMSEVCDYLIKNYPGNYPFAFYSFERKDGKFQYGLRSRSDFDVSIIAKSFGGGGHKQAAGFELDKPLE